MLFVMQQAMFANMANLKPEKASLVVKFKSRDNFTPKCSVYEVLNTESQLQGERQEFFVKQHNRSGESIHRKTRIKCRK